MKTAFRTLTFAGNGRSHLVNYTANIKKYILSVCQVLVVKELIAKKFVVLIIFKCSEMEIEVREKPKLKHL